MQLKVSEAIAMCRGPLLHRMDMYTAHSAQLHRTDKVTCDHVAIEQAATHMNEARPAERFASQTPKMKEHKV